MKKIWDMFASIRTAIVLFFFIAATSIIGTIIKQQPTPEGYEKIYGPTFTKIIKALELYDMYHSWWFQFLLILFAINLIVCSIERLPRVLRFFKKETRIKPKSYVNDLPIKCKSKAKKLSINETKETIKKFFKEKGYPVKEEQQQGETAYLFFEKGVINRVGVYITHFSILLILIGGLIGSIFGFTGYITLVEGGKSNNVVLRGGFSNKALPFQIECEKFEIQFYKNKPDVPKDYISYLKVLENGKVTKQAKVEVNHPLEYKGIYFYQSSYGVFSSSGGVLTLKVRDKKSGVVKKVSLKVGESKKIPDLGVELRLLAFYPDFVITEEGPTTRSEELRNPAALVEIKRPDNSTERSWVFAFFPNVHEKKTNYEVKFVKFQPIFYTVLQVSKDPGVWLVWIGCIFMILAILLTFFYSHRRIFVWITPTAKGTEITVGFSANRNLEAFKRWADKICEELKKTLER
ncbi:cytochrome c biogenesis protein [Thermosulfidibacter takaii ABI70S6]|uniref:Cytochrome c biogenesis protein n=1 Tax=Thermosulfidibacter takaii (strain DSM 17441 / JCM 13301 / NBRC 103674 / ABI70S6) TaxID=1298851 RepID=A0A0S3QRP9_THET7|nr:cytochrome c biogenesis protein ResB [Thermosulfidibacter takaii]BAT71000.1 cytochrome c biogenesis protein [Thermosulfidibacter takaii ABI70S6]